MFTKHIDNLKIVKGLAKSDPDGTAGPPSRSLPAHVGGQPPPRRDAGRGGSGPLAADTAAAPPPPAEGPGALDGVTAFMGLRWEDPQTVRLQIRPELINRGGLLSGVVTYAMVDYCMGSTLWAQTTREERIATISISINYIQTATEGEIVCRTVLDRRNRTIGILRIARSTTRTAACS